MDRVEIGFTMATKIGACRMRVRESDRTTATPKLHQLSANSAVTVGVWRLGNLLHRGTWSSLFEAQPVDATGSPRCDYVLKLADGASHHPTAAFTLRQEAAAAAAVHHPHLIAVLDAGLHNNVPYVVTPRLEGINLARALAVGPRQSMPVCLWWCRQLAQAVAALHAHGWCHGDIKPANAIVSPRGHLTLIDLGLARQQHSPASGFRGTLAYAAPEQFVDRATAQPASDLYSVGILLLQLLTGYDPLETEPAELARQRRQAVVPPLPEHVDFAELITALLHPEPQRRPTAETLCKRLLRLELENLGAHIRPARAA
jgi:eukaryotic-like serine/threonine-protein kinase